MNFLNPKALFI